MVDFFANGGFEDYSLSSYNMWARVYKGFIKQTLQGNIGKKVFAGHMGKVDKVTDDGVQPLAPLLSWKQPYAWTW